MHALPAASKPGAKWCTVFADSTLDACCLNQLLVALSRRVLVCLHICEVIITTIIVMRVTIIVIIKITVISIISTILVKNSHTSRRGGWVRF